MTVVHHALGEIFATALLSLYCLTGCDTTGKFAGISKEFWARPFINERNNQHLVHSLASFGNGITSEILVQFASFVCKVYRFPRSTKKIPENEIYNLSSIRHSMFLKSNAEGDKIPPSQGAFQKHVESLLSVTYMEFCKSIFY